MLWKLFQDALTEWFYSTESSDKTSYFIHFTSCQRDSLKYICYKSRSADINVLKNVQMKIYSIDTSARCDRTSFGRYLSDETCYNLQCSKHANNQFFLTHSSKSDSSKRNHFLFISLLPPLAQKSFTSTHF